MIIDDLRNLGFPYYVEKNGVIIACFTSRIEAEFFKNIIENLNHDVNLQGYVPKSTTGKTG